MRNAPSCARVDISRQPLGRARAGWVVLAEPSLGVPVLDVALNLQWPSHLRGGHDRAVGRRQRPTVSRIEMCITCAPMRRFGVVALCLCKVYILPTGDAASSLMAITAEAR
jgi:hypothetical protein